MTSNKIIPVILCGGSEQGYNTFKEKFSKTVLSLSSNSNKSLLQLTQERINSQKPK